MLTVLLAAGNALGATIYVDCTYSGLTSNGSEQSQYKKINDGLGVAAPGDTVKVPQDVSRDNFTYYMDCKDWHRSLHFRTCQGRVVFTIATSERSGRSISQNVSVHNGINICDFVALRSKPIFTQNEGMNLNERVELPWCTGRGV